MKKNTFQKKSFIISTALIITLLFSATTFAKYQYGSVLLDKHEEEMTKAKVDLVVFPHWIHSMFYKCKVCHEGPYAMKQGTADITMKDIENGEQCGTCHNGKEAFNHKKCDRCHSLSGEEAKATLKADERTKRLYPMMFTKNLTKGKEKNNKALKFADPKTTKIADLKIVADRLGVKLNTAYLKENGFPKDRLKTIDWEKILFKDKVVEPKASMDGNTKEEIRDNTIMFEVLSDFVDGVGFSHKNHTNLIGCKSCHEKVFKSELGGNAVHMRLNSKGYFCGHCHSKVSFSLAECTRCHKYEKYKKHNIEGEVLIRKNPLKDKKLLVKNGELIVGATKSKSELATDKKATEEAKLRIETEKEAKPKPKPLLNLSGRKPKKDIITTKKVQTASVIVSGDNSKKPKTTKTQTRTNVSVKVKKKEEPKKVEKKEVSEEKPKRGGCLFFSWF